ncbi:hypothetical protein LJR034_003073 [Caballeronia sp. LjRoot34]|uniref:hypothetical protein n=1 Tax=Caballeronia sp. LjRoot34 TaxID=3342325 RepID=UPI003ED09434
MKMADAKIEYRCGTIIMDRVSLDVQTGEVLVPPRLREVMNEMEKSETSSTFSVECQGRVFVVAVDANGGFRATSPSGNNPMRRSALRSLVFPSKDQRQQNGRFVHMLSAASLTGAAFSALCTVNWTAPAIAQTASLTVSGLLLAAVGFYCIKED